MNTITMTTVDRTERKRLMGLLREPAAARYQDGMNLYEFVRSNPERGVDPSGLTMTDTQAKAWLGQNQNQFKSAANGDCQAALAAMAAMYVELRRAPAVKQLFSPNGYVQNGITPGAALGLSYGPGQIKMETAEAAILNDAYGTFTGDFPPGMSPQQFRQKVADLVMNDPAKVATSMM